MSRDIEFAALVCKAKLAGIAAGTAAKTSTMVLGQAIGLSNGIDYSKPHYIEPEGPCGFAWIVVRPATSAFARYLRAKQLARPAYGGGLQIWVSEYNQSMERKEAHAEAYAAVLRDAGINAYAQSRMD